MGSAPSTIYRRLEGVGEPRRSATPWVSRQDLIEALDQGLSAPDIAAALGVIVSCVCRALAREQRMTTSQAFKQRRRLRFSELNSNPAPPLPT
jgi:hypothetical protein